MYSFSCPRRKHLQCMVAIICIYLELKNADGKKQSMLSPSENKSIDERKTIQTNFSIVNIQDTCVVKTYVIEMGLSLFI